MKYEIYSDIAKLTESKWAFLVIAKERQKQKNVDYIYNKSCGLLYIYKGLSGGISQRSQKIKIIAVSVQSNLTNVYFCYM